MPVRPNPLPSSAIRILAASALLACCATASASQDTGRETLRNGAVATWRVGPGAAAPRFGLSVPAFARWTPDGFAEPVTIRLASDTLALVDAWELAIHRRGDGRFERPLRRFRGTGRTLASGVAWDGTVGDGPALRPGETVTIRFRVRDTAGNIDEAAPQAMLVARYAMPRERAKIDALDASRASILRTGAPPVSQGIPSRGARLSVTVDGWPEDAPPHVSDVPLTGSGRGWTLRQTVPQGTHDLVVQTVRPIIGGTRAVPVDAFAVTIPPGEPMLAAVKATGKLERSSVPPDAVVPDGYRADGTVSGKAAISRPLTDREDGEDRLALALIDPARPVLLVQDARKRRALVSGHDAATAAWPGTGGAGRLVSASGGRSVSVVLDPPFGAGIVLPHADILPKSLRLSVDGASGSLAPFRDYFLDAAEGRVMLGARVLARLGTAPDTRLEARYEVHPFAPRSSGTADAATDRDRTWAADAVVQERTAGGNGRERGLIGKVLDRLLGW